MGKETFFVTGAGGCIGAWVLKNLVLNGTRVIAADLSDNPLRPRLLLSPEELEQVHFVETDITDLDHLRARMEKHTVTHIIHLAALQVPLCRVDPSLGGRVNVVGTVNVFEAAREFWGQLKGLAYASSLAVMGPADLYPQQPVMDDAPLNPQTLYGVYKQANEEMARIYWQDWGIGSIGVRPYIVYGVGRDQGITSDIAKAILAAVDSRPFHIKFSGPVGLQYASDVAQIMIQAARVQHNGAAACNLRNDVLEVSEFVEVLRSILPGGRITYETNRPLPFPHNVDDGGLRRILGRLPHTPLTTAIRKSAQQYRALLEKGQIDLRQLES